MQTTENHSNEVSESRVRFIPDGIGERMENPLYVNSKEAARLLRISEADFLRSVAKGSLDIRTAHIAQDGDLLFLRSAVINLLRKFQAQ